MTKPQQIIKQAESLPNKLNIEGKKALVVELVEFMSKKQLDGIIEQMRHKYSHAKKIKANLKKPLEISEKTKKVLEQARRPEFSEQEMDDAEELIKK